MELPAKRGPGHYRVAIVCLGNICRSPMAQVVLTDRLDKAGLTGEVVVDSSGTGDWHVGGPMDERAAATLFLNGYDGSAHRAAQYTAERTGEHDLVLAMDAANFADLLALGVGDRLRMFRDFDPDGPGDVPDPYYGGADGFERVLGMVERTADALATSLEHRS